MTLHPTKSQYRAISCDDAIPITLDDVTIAKCDKYSHVSWNPYIKPTSSYTGQRSYQPEKHTSENILVFSSQNHDCPYHVKQKVWQSALNAAIFYSCETWFTKDTRAAEVAYISTETAIEC
jgi:hypothetical protein